MDRNTTQLSLIEKCVNPSVEHVIANKYLEPRIGWNRLRLDNRRPAISVGGNLDVYFGSIFGHAVVNILPLHMIGMDGH